MNIFDGLYGYEKLMLVCGFVLFVFALAAITALIVRNRDFKAAMGLFVFAILLMGFPGIKAVEFKDGMVKLENIRQQQAPASPEQRQQAQKLLANLEQRTAGNPLLQAQVADGYRAIGSVDKAYQLAQPLLQQKPSTQVQATLVPVLTAKLNQVQAGMPVAAAPASGSAEGAGSATIPATGSRPPGGIGGNKAAPPPARSAPVGTAGEQHELATVVQQLQSTSVALPAASHVALAKAYVTLDQPQKAQSNIEMARRLDPHVQISSAVLRAAGSREQ
jgi:hypothetical protein